MLPQTVLLAGYVCFASLFVEQARAQHWAGPNEAIPQTELQTLLDRIDQSPTALMNFLSREERQAVTQEVIEWSRDQAPDDELSRRRKFEEVANGHVSVIRMKPLHWDGEKVAEARFSCVIPFRAGAKKAARYVSLMGADNDNFLYQALVTVDYDNRTGSPLMIGPDDKPKYIKRATIGLMIISAGAKNTKEVSSSAALEFGRGRRPDGESCHVREVTFME